MKPYRDVDEVYEQARVAFYHPWFTVKGGLEIISINWLKFTRFQNVDIFSLYSSPSLSFKELENFHITNLLSEGIWNKIPHAVGKIFLQPFIKVITPKKYDILFINSAGQPDLFLLRNTAKVNIMYTFTPKRLFHPIEFGARLKSKDKYLIPSIWKRLFVYLLIPVYTGLEKIAWSKLDGIIFGSRFGMYRARKKGLLKEHNKLVYDVVWPGADLISIKRKTEDPNKLSVVYLSRIAPMKRQHLLLDALFFLVKNRTAENNAYLKKTRFMIVGGFSPKEKDYLMHLKRKISKLKENGVTIDLLLNVSQERKMKILEEADIGIFLGLREDFGIVPLEYIMNGIPFLGSYPGGYWEPLQDAGCLEPEAVKVKEAPYHLLVREVAEKIITIIENIEDAKHRAEQCKKKIREIYDFSWKTMASRFDKFLANTFLSKMRRK